MSARRPKSPRHGKRGSQSTDRHGAQPKPAAKSKKSAPRNAKTERGEERSKAAFSWFPPHMHRTQQKLLEEARRADLIIEVRDARLPLGSANPDLEGVARNKPRLLLFNKASLADPEANHAWAAHFRTLGVRALFLDAETPSAARTIQTLALELTQPLRDAFSKRGMRPPEPRVIVLGIPNVGKSTLINRLLQRKRLATGPQPGVTRQSTWAPLRGKLLLMDTPGVLLPRIATDEQALRLGWIGALPQHLLGPERLAHALIALLCRESPGALPAAYPSESGHPISPGDWLAEIARRRHFLTAHSEPDILRAADQVLRDFREGKLGRLSLERAPAGAG